MASAAIVKRTERETRDLVAAHRAMLRESLSAALTAKSEAHASLVAARVAGETRNRSSARPRRAPQLTGVTVAMASNPPVAPKRRASSAPRTRRVPGNAGYMPFAVPWTDEQSVALAVAVVNNVHRRIDARASKGSVFWNAIYRAIYAGEFPELKSRVPQRAPKGMFNTRHLRKRAVRIGFVDDEFRPSVKARRVAAAANATGVSRRAAWAAAGGLLA
jgi:hypothetical protein